MSEADRPRSAVEMGDFPGLMLDVEPHDLPAGAADIQVNVTSENLGVLTSRGGFVVLNFES